MWWRVSSRWPGESIRGRSRNGAGLVGSMIRVAALTDSLPPEGFTREVERKLLESASKHIGDEKALVVFRGQTFVSPIALPLIGSLLFVWIAKPRTVIVTEKSLITVQESIWSESKVVRLVSRYRRGSVPVELSRLGLRIAQDKRIFSMIGSLPEMRRAAELGSAGG